MKTQKGFGLVETLLVILILAVVGFGGYTVWHNHSRANKSNVAGSTKKETNSAALVCEESTAGAYTVSKWSIQVPSPAGQHLLCLYHQGSSSQTVSSTTFYSRELQTLTNGASNGGCGDEVTVYRGLANDIYPPSIPPTNTAGDTSGAATFKQFFDSNSSLQVVSLGGYYYLRTGGGQSCVGLIKQGSGYTSDPNMTDIQRSAASNKEDSYRAGIINALTKMEIAK